MQPKLIRGRCTVCYNRWRKQAIKDGTFKKFDSLPSVLDRMRPKMEPQSNGCIFWTGTISPHGYGMVSVKGSLGPAHRAAYELFVGPIPTGAWIDHACHNGDINCLGGDGCMHRRCVNPQHLQPVTPRENQRRSHLSFASKTACPNGHPYTEENTYRRPDGKSRACRACIRARTIAKRKGRKPHQPLEACKRGHHMTPENTYENGGHRQCRECKREGDRRRYWEAKKKGAK